MSSISFPGHPSHSLHESQYSFASESISITPSSASSSHHGHGHGFQMNPLSSHPPARTPRTSVASSHFTSASASVYDTNDGGDVEGEGEVEGAEQVEVDEDDEEEVPEEEVAKASIRKEDVWREMVRTSEGRDKAFKLIQYSIRVYLFFHTKLSSTFLRGVLTRPWIKELVKRMTSTMSGLSFTRKLLLLFNWLTPLTLITAQQNTSITPDYTSKHPSTTPTKPTQKPFLECLLTARPPLLLDLVNAFADDLYALSLLGILSKRSGERASRFADWCWWLSTIAGLIENQLERDDIVALRSQVESRLYNESISGATEKSRGSKSKYEEKELGRLQVRDYWLQVSRAKLVMDLVFSSYDVFKIQRFREPVKAVTGLSAAILSSAKLYDRHRGVLVKKGTR